MESVLKGKALSDNSRVKLLLKYSIAIIIKICLRTGKRAQADCGIGELLFYDCFNGAIVNAGAAVYAGISIDDISLVALRDCFNGAVISAAAALDASISNFVSHDLSSKYMFYNASPTGCTSILACILENAIPFFGTLYNFSLPREKFPAKEAAYAL